MNTVYFFRIFPLKNPEETWPKMYLGQDPDPVKNRPDQQRWSKALPYRTTTSVAIRL
jgi:hypothetical protein